MYSTKYSQKKEFIGEDKKKMQNGIYALDEIIGSCKKKNMFCSYL